MLHKSDLNRSSSDNRDMEHKVDLIASLIESLEESRTRHNESQRIAKLGHWSLDIVNNNLQWSDEVFLIFSTDPESFPATYEGFLDLIHPEDRDMVNHTYTESLKTRRPYAIDHRLLLPDGSIKWVSERCETEFSEDGSPLRSIGTVNDITERKNAELKMQRMAHYDQLTDLPNRFMFFDRLEQGLIRASRNMQNIAVLFLDLDGFKQINDSRGHQAGDLLLKQVAERLHSCLREMDTVARIGGDEFAIILADITNQTGVSSVAEKIIRALARSFSVQGTDLNIGVSIGISTFPEHGNRGDMLLSRADAAMYQVKRNGKNGYMFHAQSDEPTE